MENRLGEKVADPPAPAASQIASRKELLELAVAQVETVEALANARAPAGSSPQQRLLYALCALYDRRG